MNLLPLYGFGAIEDHQGFEDRWNLERCFLFQQPEIVGQFQDSYLYP